MRVSAITTPSAAGPRVVLGSKFTGPALHLDTKTGAYWEALPVIDGNMLEIQQALLAPDVAAKKPSLLARI